MTISTTDRTFFDTNVIVYAVDDDQPAKRDIARSLIAGMDPSDFRLSTQVLAEFYVVVTRKLKKPMAQNDAEAAVAKLSKLRPLPVHPGLVRASITLSKQAQVSLWDAMIISAAAETGCTQLATEDLADRTQFMGVRIVNPFAGPRP